ncbi:uncharacterized protein LOC122948549 [Acropora millepora]|nr:uncharacterized protein LOC122948549 [Acropora millepora]
MGQTLKRKEQFQNDLYDTVRKIQENLTELERQGQEKKIEFMTLKEKMKDEMLQKDSELDELNKTLQKLEASKKKKGFFKRVRHFFCFGCTRKTTEQNAKF